MRNAGRHVDGLADVKGEVVEHRGEQSAGVVRVLLLHGAIRLDLLEGQAGRLRCSG